MRGLLRSPADGQQGWHLTPAWVSVCVRPVGWEVGAGQRRVFCHSNL